MKDKMFLLPVNHRYRRYYSCAVGRTFKNEHGKKCIVKKIDGYYVEYNYVVNPKQQNLTIHISLSNMFIYSKNIQHDKESSITKKTSG